ncbi:MAG: sugar ABC transporter substrate-binding protein [Actinomyces sp.]|uniref:ABC transporter substrate-binding protein n=1 Tax=Actinomyces sp. TaxID=29317 RepID=UPI001EB1EEE8|nr:sugar ABC transporter substrate-binding protein [Actinomyces sp.]MBS5825693.1 sugar ABC transporter substrate-binding protein [Actinomyces sp.]
MKTKFLAASALTATAALVLAGCGGGAPDSGSDSTARNSADAPVTLTVWAWEPTLTPVVSAFEEKYPNIKVDLQNVGGSADTYTKIDNVLAAGQGLPDIVQLEYHALAQYALSGELSDLTEMGAADLKEQYTPGTWNSVTIADSGKIFALPMDSGPMAMFYNKTIFDKAGIDSPPATWQEYYEAAKKIRALGDDYYILSDNGAAGTATSWMWLAGAKPFRIEGDQLVINLEDEGVITYAEFWQKLLDEDLVNTTIAGWSDDWFRGLSDGTIATLVTGAWMPANLIGSAPEASGDFRVALSPVPNAGEAVNAENGGSCLALLAKSDKQEAAYKFLEFMSVGEGAQIRVDNGNFPSTKAILEDEEFLSHTDEYFGGQEYNRVLAQAAADVIPGWSYLPFQPYANTIYGDRVAGALNGSITLKDALNAWQTDLETYAKQNGFMQ